MFRGSMFSLVGSALIATLVAAGCDNAEEVTAPAKVATTEPAKPTAPIIPVTQMADWCPEHGVPESVCTRCNESLVAGFKAKGDWDEQHNLPKSQCFQCDPSLKDQFVAAYKAKYGKEPPTGPDNH